MCLIIKDQDPRLAREDITVYKALRGTRSLISGDFQYVPGFLHNTQIKQSTDFCCADDKASDWLRDNCGHRWRDNRIVEKLISLGEGFHSCRELERAESMRAAYLWVGNVTLWKCIIPKGSIYYEDPTGLIVSNNLRVEEQL